MDLLEELKMLLIDFNFAMICHSLNVGIAKKLPELSYTANKDIRNLFRIEKGT